MSRTRRAAAAVCLASLTALAVLSSAAPAAAQSPDVPELVFGGISDEDVQSLQVDSLYPGGPVATTRYVLRRGSGFDGGRFSFGVQALEDLERGCNGPEVKTGDTTCGDGPDQGELSRQLLLGHAWSGDVEDCVTATSPTSGLPLGDVADVVLSAPPALSGQNAVCLVLSAALPVSADNLVQSDLVRFDLRLGLAGAESVEVLSGRVEQPIVPLTDSDPVPLADQRPPVAAGSGTVRSLPFTGTTLLAAALWAAAAVSLGAVVLAGGGGRHRA